MSDNYHITFSYSDCTGTPTSGAAPDGMPLTSSIRRRRSRDRMPGSVREHGLRSSPSAENPHPGGKLPVYWWKSEIADAGAECVRRRRTLTRLRGRGDADAATTAREAYQSARRVLKQCIRDSKASWFGQWRTTCGENPTRSSWKASRATHHGADGAARGSGHHFGAFSLPLPPEVTPDLLQ